MTSSSYVEGASIVRDGFSHPFWPHPTNPAHCAAQYEHAGRCGHLESDDIHARPDVAWEPRTALRPRYHPPTLVVTGVHVWPSGGIGWRWHLRTGLDFHDGRPIIDSGKPEAYAWAPTRAAAMRRARRHAGRQLGERLDLPVIDRKP